MAMGDYLLFSHYPAHRPDDSMRLPDFLSIPLRDRRARSQAGTLRSTAGSLSVILKYCDVPQSTPPLSRCIQPSYQTMGCRQAIESLTPRVERLAELFSVPPPEGEVEEEERRTVLTQ